MNRPPRPSSATRSRRWFAAGKRQRRRCARGDPRDRYATTADGVSIAYQVVGEGAIDFVFVTSAYVSNVELAWEWPVTQAVFKALRARRRLTLFDRRGAGLSDSVSGERLPTIEARMEDIRAVMDAAGVGRAVLYGIEDGAAQCFAFAATYPERARVSLCTKAGDPQPASIFALPRTRPRPCVRSRLRPHHAPFAFSSRRRRGRAHVPRHRRPPDPAAHLGADAGHAFLWRPGRVGRGGPLHRRPDPRRNVWNFRVRITGRWRATSMSSTAS
jgi:pimeloyl-ACP methyl ester carboxylesterase